MSLDVPGGMTEGTGKFQTSGQVTAGQCTAWRSVIARPDLPRPWDIIEKW
ncbi:MAG: hypothetical protein R3B37_14035 [Nitrospira sp.]|nr:hypothetical protein [Nitrospira sp.]